MKIAKRAKRTGSGLRKHWGRKLANNIEVVDPGKAGNGAIECVVFIAFN